MTDEQIIKAFEEIIKNQNNKLSLIEQAVCADVLSLAKRTKDEGNKHRNKYQAVKAEFTRLYDTVCCQKAEIEELKAITGIMNTRKYYRKFVDEVFKKEMGNMCMSPDFDYIYELYFQQRAEIEELKNRNAFLENEYKNQGELFWERVKIKQSEAIKEFADKINELLARYSHLHNNAENAIRDTIEAVDGTDIEMQSVWDVFTLKNNEMVEYEEMSRLQENIETIANERLLREIEKDFRLLVKEMTEEQE